MRWVILAVVFVAGLGLGALSGGGGTETITETVAPQACDVALDYASEGFNRAANAVRGGGAQAFADWMSSNAENMAAASAECRVATR